MRRERPRVRESKLKYNDASAGTDASNDEDAASNTESDRRYKRRRRTKKLYCGSCWRMEYHYPLVRNKTVIAVFAVITFGMFLYFRTYKCKVCGAERMAGGD